MMKICGHEYALYRDDDKGNFHWLDLSGKIVYMEQRVERDLLKPCRYALRFASCVHVGLLVPTLICAGISAASTFRHGGRTSGTDRDHFVKFAHDYMDPLFLTSCPSPNRPSDTYADWLYRYVRCGLSHSFSIEWGQVQGKNLTSPLQMSSSGEPQLNQHWFLEEFERGWIKYLTMVRGAAAGTLGVNFERRFDEIFKD